MMMFVFLLIPNQLVHPVVLLALLQRLIESVTEGQIRLGLSALDEAFDLPSTSPSLILLLLSILRLLLLLILLRLLLVLLLCWLGTATTSHHSSDSTASHMANSATNSDSTSSHCHLLHHTGLLGLPHCRRRSSHWCRRGWGRRRCPWSRSWRSSSHGSSWRRRGCSTTARHFHFLISNKTLL